MPGRGWRSVNNGPLFFFFPPPYTGGERVHGLGTNGSAPRQHEGRVRAGVKRRAVRGTARANRRPLHPEAHEKTKQPSHLARAGQREGTDAQDLLLRVRLSNEGRRLSAGEERNLAFERGTLGGKRTVMNLFSPFVSIIDLVLAIESRRVKQQLRNEFNARIQSTPLGNWLGLVCASNAF